MKKQETQLQLVYLTAQGISEILRYTDRNSEEDKIYHDANKLIMDLAMVMQGLQIEYPNWTDRHSLQEYIEANQKFNLIPTQYVEKARNAVLFGVIIEF